MRKNLQHFIDRVSAENWEQHLPAPSTIRGEARRAMPRRTLAVVGAAAVVVTAVGVPTVIAKQVDSPSRTQAAAQPAAAAFKCPPGAKKITGKPVVKPLVKGQAIPATALLTKADAVPGYRDEFQQQSGIAITGLPGGGDVAPELAVGQVGAATSSITAVGTPFIQLMQAVLRYAPGKAADGFRAAAIAAACPDKTTILSYNEGPAPQVIVKLAPRTLKAPATGGGSPPRGSVTLPPRWAVVTQSGDYVNIVVVDSLTDPAALKVEPGLPYLKTLGEIVRAKSADDSAPPVPLPPGPNVKAPKGFLATTDLGADWRSDSVKAGKNRTFTLSTATCNQGRKVELNAPATTVDYRGFTPDAKQMMVEETVMRTTDDNAKKIMAAHRQLTAAKCSKSGQISSPSGVGDEALLSHTMNCTPVKPPAGVGWGDCKTTGQPDPGSADIWMRSGGTIVHLRVATGDIGFNTPMAGGDAWLTEIARTAVDRAEG